METFNRLVSIRFVFSKLNVVEDWIKLRLDALHYDDGAPAALLVLQKVIMNSSDDPHEIQLVMIKSAFKNWEGIASSSRPSVSTLWNNVLESSKAGNARASALLELRKAIYDDV